MASPNNGFNFGASAAPAGGPASGGQPSDPMQLLMQYLMQGQQQQQPAPFDAGAAVSGVRAARDPQGAANRGYQPGVQNQYNPFDNGFFKTAEQRQQVEQDHLGNAGFSSLTPYAQAGALHANPTPDFAGAAMGASPGPFQLDPSTLALLHGSMPGAAPVSNPFMPQTAGARPPKFSGPPAGPQGNARPAAGSPRPSFSFGF